MGTESSQLGRYEIVGEIGRGGMAVVYLARQRDLGRLVALKQLPAFKAGDQDYRARFARESRIAGTLNHHNVVTVYDAFEDQGVPYLAMEYVAGGSLRPLVGRLGLAQVAGVLGDLLAALAYAGGRGVVHRDLKPENLLVTEGGRVKVADFGIAKVVGEGAVMTYATQTGLVLGTPYYMSPEQARSGEVGTSSDLYATGVIAYELLLLQVPFAKSDTPISILMAHVAEPPPAPATIDPAIDPRLADWLVRMLAKHPADRPPDASTAWQELEEIVTDLLGPFWRRDAALPDPRTLPAGAGSTLPSTSTPRPAPAVPSGVATPAAPPEPSRTRDDSALYEATPVAPAPPPAPPTTTGPPRAAPPPPPPADRRGKGRLIAALGVVAALVVAVVLAASGVLGGGDDATAGPTAPTTTGTTPPTTPPGPAGAPRDASPTLTWTPAGLLVADPASGFLSVPADAGERVVRRVDPAGPRGIVAAAGGVYVLDGEAVGLHSAGDLLPTFSLPFPGGNGLAAAPDGTVAVTAASDGRGTACLLRPAPEDGAMLAPCIDLAFTPGGLGVADGGRQVAVADREGGSVSLLTRRGDALRVGETFAVGAEPHGRILLDRGRLFVAVAGDLAVVDSGNGEVLRTLAPGGTPADIALSERSGRLLVAVPTSSEVLVYRADELGAAPVRRTLPSPPVALAPDGARDRVWALLEDGRILPLDDSDGRVRGEARRIPLGGDVPPRLTLREVALRGAGARLTATLRFEGGRLDPATVLVRDRNPADGAARVAIWQGGIAGAGTARHDSGARVEVAQFPGILSIRFLAPAGRFERGLTLRVSPDRRTVTFTVVASPQSAPPPSPEPGPQPGPQPPPTPTPQTEPPPPHTNTTPVPTSPPAPTTAPPPPTDPPPPPPTEPAPPVVPPVTPETPTPPPATPTPTPTPAPEPTPPPPPPPPTLG